MARLLQRLHREDGQAMVEYTLIVALISIVALTLMVTVGSDIKGIFSDIGDALTSVVP